MNRSERRAVAGMMRAQAKEWPRAMVEIPESQWPAPRPGHVRPEQVWRSSGFLAQLFGEPWFNGTPLHRLSVNRVTIGGDGRFDGEISWDELMRIKREVGYGDWYAIEVLPRDRDIVNVANMRHIWMMAEPLPIGWFA